MKKEESNASVVCFDLALEKESNTPTFSRLSSVATERVVDEGDNLAKGFFKLLKPKAADPSAEMTNRTRRKENFRVMLLCAVSLTMLGVRMDTWSKFCLVARKSRRLVDTFCHELSTQINTTVKVTKTRRPEFSPYRSVATI